MNALFNPKAVIPLAAAFGIFSSTMAAMGQQGFGGIDSHIHLYAPPSKSPKLRMGSARNNPVPIAPDSFIPAAKELIQKMDQRNVAKAIVMPPPQYWGQPGAYGYTALLPAIQQSGGRLLLAAGGGELNPMIMQTKPEEVTDKIRKLFESQANEIVKAGAVAFGEMTALHVCMNSRHHYMAAPPDHPLFLLLADISAKSGLPIDLHMEAVHEKTPMPKRLLLSCGANPNQLPPTIPGLERLLAHNRGAKIVWQHIGWDNTGFMTPSLLERLLRENPNLFLSIRVLDPQQVKREGKEESSITDPLRRIKPEWARLFADFPDRIMAGGDEFFGMKNGGPFVAESFEETWRAIDNLLEPNRSKISWQNAARIYNIDR